VPDSLLHILNACLLALLLLFFLRVLRAVWVQVNAPPLPPHAAPSLAARAGPPARSAAPAASAAAATGLRLRVVEPEAHKGETYPLGDEVTVGRAAGCGVALPDTTVSQLHARMFRQDGHLYIEDLGSTNGTWVNQVRVSAPVPVKRGDYVQIGSTVLEVAK